MPNKVEALPFVPPKPVKEEKPTPEWEWALLKGHLRIELIPGVIIIGIITVGSWEKEIEPICQTILPFQFSPFLFSTLINNFLTVSISSALLDATNRVKLANASLLMMDWLADVNSSPFLSKKSKKQAAAIRLFPSTNAWFFTIKYNNIAAFSSMDE